MAHAVTWFQISGRDGKKLESFYTKLFKWKSQPDPSGSMAMIAAEKGGIAGGIGKSQNGQASVAVYIDCDDIEGCLEAVEKAGGKVAMDPMDLQAGMGRIAGFLDPAGNWVGLWSQAAPAPKRGSKKKSAPKKRAAAKKTAPKKKGAKKSKRR